MSVFYLVVIILGVAFQNVAKKPYTQKTQGRGVYIFSCMTSFVALLFFVFTAGKLSFDAGLFIYAFLFALSYMSSAVFGVLAIACGSLSLTALIVSYSLMLPTLYGIIFLKDPISVGLIPGIALLVISLFLTNKKGENTQITLKWLVCVTIAAVGNGMCSVTQKMQQVVYDGAFKNEFMIIALAMVVVMLLFFVFAKERKDIKMFINAGWSASISCGIVNGLVNLLVMLLSGLMAASVMFPLISVGGIVVTYLVSRFYYKESITKSQSVGFVLGLAAIVLLNI